MAFFKQQNNFTGGILSERMFGQVTAEVYQKSAAILKNWIVQVYGGITKRGGTRYGWEVKDSTKNVRLIPFEYNAETGYVIEAGDLYFRFGKEGSQILSGTPVEIVTPYAEAHLFELKFTQSANVMWITHPSYAPRRLERTSDTAWTLTAENFIDGPYLLINTTTTTMVSSVAGPGAATLTASATTGINSGAGFQTTDVGRLVRVYNGTRWSWADITAWTSTTVVTINIVDGTFPTVATLQWRLGKYSDTTGYPAAVGLHDARLVYAGGAENPQDFDFSQVDLLNWFQFGLQDPTVPGTLSPADGGGYTILDRKANSIRWLLSHRGGLGIGSSDGAWLAAGSGGPDDPITGDGNINAKRHSSKGSEANVTPVAKDNAVLFVSKNGRRLHEFAYLFDDDSYRTPDLSILAENLTRSATITDMDIQESSEVVWCVLSDGTMLSLTYMRPEAIVAWANHDTRGEFESVCCVFETDRDVPYVVVKRSVNGAIVKYVEYLEQEYDGTDSKIAYHVDAGGTYNDPKTIEAMTAANPIVVTITGHGYSDADLVDFSDIVANLNDDDGFEALNGNRYKVANSTANTFELTDEAGANIDGSGYTSYYEGGNSRKALTTITGADQLEGELVQVFSDGAYVGDKTVASGSITLTKAGSIVSYGLKLDSDFQTLPIEFAEASDGSTLGREKTIGNIYMRVTDSYGGRIGPSLDEADLIDIRFNEEQKYDTAPTLLDGERSQSMDAKAGKAISTDVRVSIRHDIPLPFTLNALVVDYELEEGN